MYGINNNLKTQFKNKNLKNVTVVNLKMITSFECFKIKRLYLHAYVYNYRPPQAIFNVLHAFSTKANCPFPGAAGEIFYDFHFLNLG